MPQVTLALPDAQWAFAQDEAAAAGQTPDAVVAAALAELEDRKMAAEFKTLMDEALAGPMIPLDQAYFEALRERCRAATQEPSRA